MRFVCWGEQTEALPAIVTRVVPMVRTGFGGPGRTSSRGELLRKNGTLKRVDRVDKFRLGRRTAPTATGVMACLDENGIPAVRCPLPHTHTHIGGQHGRELHFGAHVCALLETVELHPFPPVVGGPRGEIGGCWTSSS